MPQNKSRASARVVVLELSPGEWVFATCYMLNTLGAASPLAGYPHDIRSPSSPEALLLGLSQLGTYMERAEKDRGSTAPSKAQIKQVRDWINSQRAIYAQPLRAAA